MRIRPVLLAGSLLLSPFAEAGPEGEIGIGRTENNRLVAHVGFAPPKPIQRSIFPTLPGFATSLIGFENIPVDEPAEGIFTLAAECDISVTVTHRDEGLALIDGPLSLNVGDTIHFGAPFFDSHPIYHMLPSAAPGQLFEVRFVLHDATGLYTDSEEFSVSLTPACTADVDDGTGIGVPDGGVTIDDLLFYLDAFTRGVLSADIDDGNATGNPDGGVTIDDLLFYIQRFEEGC